MHDIVYEIVQHDGGWAYKVNGVFSEPFPTHAEALAAAQVAAAEQEIPGQGKPSNTRMTKGSGTRKPPAVKIAHTPQSRMRIERSQPRAARRHLWAPVP